MNDYPQPIVPVNHVEPVPRRIRATLAGESIFDTTNARYLWERPSYPQFYVPFKDVRQEFLTEEAPPTDAAPGAQRLFGLRVGDTARSGAARLHAESTIEGIAGTMRFDWSALDSWYEEDEEVFIHPRSPYVRVDALRSSRTIRVELDGKLLAESSSPVMVFETGLPTRYYLNRTEVNFDHLVASGTVSFCPYKGRTSGYWSALVGGQVEADVAWAYDFPMRELLPISGLIAFYNEKVDITLDGEPLARPVRR